ncbi:50S ribosomal protein L4 [Tuberibacillus sp. Marseille-P3662]|uniref:50S ribosomal protein L4 n=1 Tax=Tuberibacillus sp. Marseille-P3662 TaxID=1965358 RepID=UPI000A1CCB64|nr:50S ribosomal protein L4 [Tuberibacillus sp. Marseille-P3662]
MPKLNVLDQNGSQVGDVELTDTVFGIEPNQNALYEAIVMQQASRRQGTHATKNRSAVRGGGKKPWRQKGTGRARQGSIRAPQWVGGGTVFGPSPRSYGYKLPKKVRRLALKSALSSKVQDGSAIVLDNLTFDKPKTKEFVNVLNNLSADQKVLVVIGENDDAVERSGRNLPNVQIATPDQVNVLDVVNHDQLIVTKDAAAKLEEVLG